MKKILLLAIALSVSNACIVKKKTSRNKFATLNYHLGLRGVKMLINNVHEKHWDIAYSFGAECPEERKANVKEIEKAITTALQTWLQPLRKVKTKAPIINEFRLQKLPEITLDVWKKADFDLGIIDHCKKGRSAVGRQPNLPPLVNMRVANIDNIYMTTLVHEIGHVIGLGDTYVGRARKPVTTKGGLAATVGTQPASAMSVHLYNHTSHYLSEDDKNGIIWLYKVTYEDLDPADCFFPNYEFEETPEGCVPKYPLIFEIRQGHETYALDILRDDKNIDINAQDSIGFTALHYAVAGRHMLVVKELLSRKDIKPWLKDKEGRHVLKLAQDLGMDDVVKLIKEIPWSVDAKGKKITTWGEMKKEQ